VGALNTPDRPSSTLKRIQSWPSATTGGVVVPDESAGDLVDVSQAATVKASKSERGIKLLQGRDSACGHKLRLETTLSNSAWKQRDQTALGNGAGRLFQAVFDLATSRRCLNAPLPGVGCACKKRRLKKRLLRGLRREPEMAVRLRRRH